MPSLITNLRAALQGACHTHASGSPGLSPIRVLGVAGKPGRQVLDKAGGMGWWARWHSDFRHPYPMFECWFESQQF